MTNGEIERIQQTISVMAMIVAGLPLDDYIAAANYADSVGPVLDPTLWRRGHEKLADIRRMAEALREFQAVASEFFVKYGKVEP